MKKFAFTLAETLIVMGIIGVVAALTLPNLNSSTGDREKVAKLKKVYQNLNDLNGRLIGVYGKLEDWNCNNYISFSECYHSRMADYIKASKTCNNSNCAIDGQMSGDNYGGYILPDGASIVIGGKGFAPYNTSKTCVNDICILDITVYLESKSKFNTNVGGIQRFQFYLSASQGIVPDGKSYSKCIDHSYKSSCTAWIIDFGNMDYLKTDSSGKCKNSSIVLDGVNNTTCK